MFTGEEPPPHPKKEKKKGEGYIYIIAATRLVFQIDKKIYLLSFLIKIYTVISKELAKLNFNNN